MFVCFFPQSAMVRNLRARSQFSADVYIFFGALKLKMLCYFKHQSTSLFYVTMPQQSQSNFHHIIFMLSCYARWCQTFSNASWMICIYVFKLSNLGSAENWVFPVDSQILIKICCRQSQHLIYYFYPLINTIYILIRRLENTFCCSRVLHSNGEKMP